jgi:S-DNA-T family DNA segregation ATPase FtsK/SpoIIIE
VVSIEVPKDNPPTVKLLSLISGLGASVPPATAVLGQDSEGLPILLRLPSPDVTHVLITGTTGSGKTELAKSMILGLTLCNRPDAVRLLLIDPKGRGYRAFSGLPHLICPVVSDVDEAHERLEGLVSEMERRDKAGQSEPRVMVFVDELADLMMVGGKQMIHVMTRLTQRGREAGIHIIACTQKPTAAIVGGLVKSNFPARLVGSVASADDARIAAGISGSGAEKLAGRGDFLLVVKGEVRRIQAAYAPADELAVAVQRLTSQPLPHSAPVLPAQRPPAPGTTRPQQSAAVPTPIEAAALDDFDDDDLDRVPDTSDSLDEAQPEDCECEASTGQAVLPPAPTASVQASDPFAWRMINNNLRIGYRRP